MTESAIDRLPKERNFGKGFDYSQWNGKNSQATLHRVRWSSDYRDVVSFTNDQALNDYLDTTPKISGFKYHYLKMNQPLKIDVPFNQAMKYNYIHVWNFEQPIGGDEPRHLYYFINDVIYKSPQSTELVLQLDVWQTFGRTVTWGRGYVEQGHVGLAQDASTDPLGQRFLTVPEGLDVGSDYQVVSRGVGMTIMRASEYALYSILVMSSVDLEADGGTVDKPALKTATGSDFERLPNGANIYLFETLDSFKTMLSNLSEKPWMTQGIVSITAMPNRFMTDKSSWPSVTIGGVAAKKPNRDSTLKEERSQSFTLGLRETAIQRLPERYRRLRKFLTFPYLAIEVSSYTGEPMILRPELWDSEKGELIANAHFAPPAPRVGIYPKGYNTRERVQDDESGEFLNNATYISNFPQFSVVNNGYLSIMASQAHGIAQSYRVAEWSQNKANTAAGNAFNMGSNSVNTASEMRNISNATTGANTALANETRGYRAGVNMVGSALQGNIVGMLGEGANAAIDLNQNVKSSNIAISNTNRTAEASMSNMMYQNDTNYSYAKYAARGDYQTEINGIQARLQDAKLTQPTASGGLGGDAYLMSVYKVGVDVKMKMPNLGAVEIIGEYWLRYGYAVNRFMKLPANLQTMSRFTYWKVKESYIVDAACSEPMKQTLRGIIESGVTVWQYPNDIGTLDPYDNSPMTANYYGV